MKYKIRDADGEIYTFNNVEELLLGFVRVLGDNHEYRWNGEWYE